MMSPVKQLSNILVLRNHLVKIPESKLIEMYSNYDYYLAFLNSLWLLVENDSAFLLFDDSMLKKILSVIQIYRFDAKDEGVKKEVNDIIDYINGLRSCDEAKKNTLKNNYLAFQEEKRCATFYSTEGLLDSLSYDAIVFSALQNNDMKSIIHDEHYILSLNYLIYMCPELFKDKEVQQRAIKRLDEANSNARILSPNKKLIKQTKEHLSNINKKEE